MGRHLSITHLPTFRPQYNSSAYFQTSNSLSTMTDDPNPPLTVTSLLSGISSMPPETKVKISTILGALVADAASLPLQWIYKDKDMEAIGHWKLAGDKVEGDSSPAFYPTSKCPFFSLPTGANSCYGDDTRTCLSAMADKEGDIDLAHVHQKVQDTFGAAD